MPLLPQVEDIVFSPQIDANKRRRANGAKGGRPTEKPMVSILCAEEKPNVNDNDNVNANDNVNVNEKEIISDTCPQAESVFVDKIVDNHFDQLWQLYPVQRGKGKVTQHQKYALKNISLEEMARAISRYTKEVEEHHKYPQNGGSFFTTGYLDYLDETYRSIIPLMQPGTKGSSANNFTKRSGKLNYDELIS